MTKTNIYDSDLKRLENLAKLSGDSIAEIIEEALDYYEQDHNMMASHADLVLERDEVSLEDNYLIINKQLFDDFQADYCIYIVLTDDPDTVLACKMIKEDADLIWLEIMED